VLTTIGSSLGIALGQLGDWAERWAVATDGSI
jgi:hypothetical protein